MISVLINTYNQNEFIIDSIKSVIDQDFKGDYEIIIIDDGSVFPIHQEVDRFKLLYPDKKLRYIYKDNGGQASSLNLAVKLAEGEILCFLDGDDTFNPDKLRIIQETFESYPDLSVLGHGIRQFSENDSKDITIKKKVKVLVNNLNSASVFTKIRALTGTSRLTIHKKEVDNLFPIPQSLKIEADEYLFTKAALTCGILCIPNVLTNYRIHENNLYMISYTNHDFVKNKKLILQTIKDINEKLIFSILNYEDAQQVVDEINYQNDHGIAELGIYLDMLNIKSVIKYRLTKKFIAYNLLGYKNYFKVLSYYSKIKKSDREPKTIILL